MSDHNEVDFEEIEEELEESELIHWLAPYIDTEGFIGYTRYEEYDDPTLIYIDDRDVIYKGVE